MKRRSTRRHRGEPREAAPKAVFSKAGLSKKRRAAVRLDLSETGGVGSMLWTQKSNRWALIISLLFLSGLAVYFLREYDLSSTVRNWGNAKPLTSAFDYELPAQLPVEDTKVETPVVVPPERSRAMVAMEFQPRASAEALKKTALALDAAKFGQHAEARVLIDEALEIDPTYVGWYYYSGRVASLAGDWRKMNEALQASIKKDEAVLSSLQLLGDSAFYLGDYKAAVSCFGLANQLYPEEAWFLIRISQGLRGQGEWKGSREAALAAAALPGGDWVGAWVALAEMGNGGNPPQDLAEKLEGNTVGNRAGWWLVAAAAASHEGRSKEAARALDSFKKLANEDTLNAGALDPLMAKWSTDPHLADALPELPVFSWRKIRVMAPQEPPAPPVP